MGTCRRCPCGGHYERRTVEVRFRRSAEPLGLDGVEQEACTRCGGRAYTVETLERLEAMHRGEPSDPGLHRLTARSVPAADPPP